MKTKNKKKVPQKALFLKPEDYDKMTIEERKIKQREMESFWGKEFKNDDLRQIKK